MVTLCWRCLWKHRIKKVHSPGWCGDIHCCCYKLGVVVVERERKKLHLNLKIRRWKVVNRPIWSIAAAGWNLFDEGQGDHQPQGIRVGLEGPIVDLHIEFDYPCSKRKQNRIFWGSRNTVQGLRRIVLEEFDSDGGRIGSGNACVVAWKSMSSE